MTVRPVSPAILSLVQHVELNRAGWWDRTVQQFILARLFEASTPTPLDAVCSSIDAVIARRLERGYLEAQVNELERSGHVVELPSQGLVLSEAARERVRAASAAIAENNRSVQQRLRDEVEARHIDIDAQEVWDAFLACALQPMVTDLGARTYEVIAGGDLRQDATDFLQAFLQRFPESARPRLAEVAIALMDPKDPSIRSFILRQLNARFVIDAAGLRREVLEELARGAGRKAKTLLFVDTNFLFSVLQLHANPANEAAGALLVARF